jgi:hypothetical protein
VLVFKCNIHLLIFTGSLKSHLTKFHSGFYAPPPTKWKAYVELHSSVRLSVRTSPKSCGVNLINYQSDVFLKLAHDQAGCVDERKEKNFSCDHFYQSYGTLLQMLL